MLLPGCVIHTRVSTEYGLEQEFDSFDAQPEGSKPASAARIRTCVMAVSADFDPHPL
jgi:hypothetical protein